MANLARNYKLRLTKYMPFKTFYQFYNKEMLIFSSLELYFSFLLLNIIDGAKFMRMCSSFYVSRRKKDLVHDLIHIHECV